MSDIRKCYLKNSKQTSLISNNYNLKKKFISINKQLNNSHILRSTFSMPIFKINQSKNYIPKSIKTIDRLSNWLINKKNFSKIHIPNNNQYEINQLSFLIKFVFKKIIH